MLGPKPPVPQHGTIFRKKTCEEEIKAKRGHKHGLNAVGLLFLHEKDTIRVYIKEGAM